MSRLSLGGFIRMWREHNGFSQKQVASWFHVTQQAVSSWEKDRSRPPPQAAFVWSMMTCTPIRMWFDTMVTIDLEKLAPRMIAEHSTNLPEEKWPTDEEVFGPCRPREEVLASLRRRRAS